MTIVSLAELKNTVVADNTTHPREVIPPDVIAHKQPGDNSTSIYVRVNTKHWKSLEGQDYPEDYVWYERLSGLGNGTVVGAK